MPSKFEKSTIGKTLIAAVVMYNYFTWYPEGKICFMAPSRPLVMQQLEACTNIMGISEDETAMLEGSVSKKDRYLIWRQKRVFFCTPQTFMNDLHSNDATATDFVLLVFDEAHRAMGQYAYCQVIQAMDKASSPSRYRVLALSATPGADRKAVQDLIFNLHIEHIELRTEDDPEILKHTHHKQLEFVCTKGFGSFDDRILSSLLSLMTEPAQYLHNYGMLVSMELTTLAPFILDEVVIKLNRFRETAPTVVLACEFNLKCLRSLVHWRTILRHNGALSLLAVITKALNGDESHIQQMSRAESFDRLLRTLKTAPHNTSSRSTLSNQKTETLKSVLSEHFTRKGGNARVIVFVMLRETVSSVVVELNHMKGIHAHEFVGQANKTGAGGISKGLNQREQREVLSAFNSGAYNVLVATSIAEEVDCLLNRLYTLQLTMKSWL
jgi:Fanconi anemia group M protein